MELSTNLEDFEILADETLDSDHFNISGNKLQITSPLDFEANEEYSIRVKGTDPEGLSIEKVITVNATDVPKHRLASHWIMIPLVKVLRQVLRWVV